MLSATTINRRALKDEYTALWAWLSTEGAKAYPVLRWVFGVPSLSLLDTRTVQTFKSWGSQPGVPGVMLLFPRHDAAGLALLLKTRQGAVSSSERAWGAWLGSQHFCFRICYGWEAARDALLAYIGSTTLTT